jgi:hypothetical protein
MILVTFLLFTGFIDGEIEWSCADNKFYEALQGA